MANAMGRGVYRRTSASEVELQRFLSLLWALVIREFKGRYRRSLLGPAWGLIQPLAYTAMFAFVGGILSISSEGMPYILFTYSAMVPWTFLSNAVTRCGPVVYANSGIIKKTAIPREVFPIAEVARSLIDLFVASLVLVGLLVWFRVPLGLPLLWLPLLVLLLILLAVGVGLGVAALSTYQFDVFYALPFIMQLWLLATPVMYPIGNVPERYRFLYSLNPMVGIVEGFRTVLTKSVMPDLGLLAWSVVGIVVIWVVAWPLFRFMSQYFADVL